MIRIRRTFPASLLLLTLLTVPVSAAAEWRVQPCIDVPCPWEYHSAREFPLITRPLAYPKLWHWHARRPLSRGLEIMAPSLGTGTGEIAPADEDRAAVLIASQEMESQMSAAALNPLDDQLPGALRGTLFTLDLGLRYIF